MLHGIVVFSNNKVIYSVLNLCLFVQFSNTFLIQVKDYNVVIDLIAGWFGLNMNGKYTLGTKAAEKVDANSLYCSSLWADDIEECCFF